MRAPDLPAEMSADEYTQWVLENGDEHAFQVWAVNEARSHGWLAHYLPDWLYRLAFRDMRRRSRGDRDWPDKGFPDLFLLHPDRGVAVVWEMKATNGSVSKEQRLWIDGLSRAGLNVTVRKPRDRAEMLAILRGEC